MEKSKNAPDPRKRLRGAQSRVAGECFERYILAACEWYRSRGEADIDKAHEPMKPLRAPNARGQFLACYTKPAQPDFDGTLAGGRSIKFEAKHTDDARIERSRLTPQQMEKLESHHRLGAIAFVLVSFSLQEFARIPWPVWRDMAKIYGRKYITREEAREYAVPCIAGTIKLLDKLPPDVITVKAGAADVDKIRRAVADSPGVITTGEAEEPAERPIAVYEGNGRKAVVAGDGNPSPLLYSTAFYEDGELEDVRYYQSSAGARRAARTFIKGGAT